MDRPTTLLDADTRNLRTQPHEAFVLPSRRIPLELGRTLLGPGPTDSSTLGPILLTGDAGVGKTWLCRRLEAEALPHSRWVSVDLTPSNTPADLYRLISHELGLTDSSDRSVSRVDLVDYLAERQADGQRLTLVIDEAQNLALSVWEEIRIMANRLDRPAGFSRMLLVGQTSLARRFATRPFAAIEARLASKIHLGPIDADEALELVARFSPARDWTAEEVEALHRDARGNPRRILRKLGPATAQPTELPKRQRVAAIEVIPARREPTPSAVIAGPLIGPAKPPIRIDENMIEVGWSPEDSLHSGESGGPDSQQTTMPSTIVGGEEAVQDHYAALQAWREWTENQTRRSDQSNVAVVNSNQSDNEAASEVELDSDEESEEDDEAGSLPTSRTERSRLRAERKQNFAPFGQLFSKMSQTNEFE